MRMASKALVQSASHNNQLLGALRSLGCEGVEAHLRRVDLKRGYVVCEAGNPLKHAYFPEDCVLSLLTVLESGSEIECANVGREGAFGLFAAMYSRVSYNRCVVQIAGTVIQCPIDVVRADFEASENVRNLLVSYSETLVSQVMQSAACNAFHTVRQRMCRRLLTMHDRAGGKPLAYTHELLSRMLGSNRTSVTIAAKSLRDDGFITYSRGMIQITDSAAMREASCECNTVVKARFDAFLRPPSSAVPGDFSGRIAVA